MNSNEEEYQQYEEEKYNGDYQGQQGEEYENYEEEEEEYNESAQDQDHENGNGSENLGTQGSKDVAKVRKWQWANPLIEGVGPTPRGGHSATLSGASIIIFGGHYYGGKQKGFIYLNDTFVLDVNANRWIKPKISGTPPAQRYFHSSILAGSRMIIFGGKGEKGMVFRDLHALDPSTMTWYQGPEGSGSPCARYGHTATLVAGSKMLIFGGTDGKNYFNDLYVLDLEIMAWTQPKTTGPAPSPRMGHTAMQIGSNLLIQGGFFFSEEAQKAAGMKQGNQLRSSYLNDLRILDTETYVWSRLRVSGTPPLPRYGHTCNISGPDIVVFGGWNEKSGSREKEEKSDPSKTEYFMVLNTDAMTWEHGKYVGTPPLNRYGHTCTSIGPHLLVFGGWEYSRATNEVVVLRDLTLGATGKDGEKK